MPILEATYEADVERHRTPNDNDDIDFLGLCLAPVKVTS